MKKTALQLFAQHIKGAYPARTYKHGLEFRAIGGLDQLQQDARTLIHTHGWPLEIFEVDVRVRSISVHQITAP